MIFEIKFYQIFFKFLFLFHSTNLGYFCNSSKVIDKNILEYFSLYNFNLVFSNFILELFELLFINARVYSSDLILQCISIFSLSGDQSINAMDDFGDNDFKLSGKLLL